MTIYVTEEWRSYDDYSKPTGVFGSIEDAKHAYPKYQWKTPEPFQSERGVIAIGKLDEFYGVAIWEMEMGKLFPRND